MFLDFKCYHFFHYNFGAVVYERNSLRISLLLIIILPHYGKRSHIQCYSGTRFKLRFIDLSSTPNHIAGSICGFDNNWKRNMKLVWTASEVVIYNLCMLTRENRMWNVTSFKNVNCYCDIQTDCYLVMI